MAVPSGYRRAGPQQGIACEALERLPPPCCVRVLFLSARVPRASPPEPGFRLPNGIRHGTASRVDGGGSREPTLLLLPAFGVTDGALCAIWARFLASVAAVAALASVATVYCCPPPLLMMMMMMPSLPLLLAHTAGCWLLAAGCWLLAAGCGLRAAGCGLLLLDGRSMLLLALDFTAASSSSHHSLSLAGSCARWT